MTVKLRNGNVENHLIKSFKDLEKIARDALIVTMFSGGADSTFLLWWLRKNSFLNIHAVTVNVGAPMEHGEVERQKEAAEHFQAEFVVLEGRQAFIDQAIVPAIRAQARYLNGFPISSSLSRPVIAAIAVDYARKVGARVILHTANLSQNSLPRLNNGIALKAFEGSYGSPYVRSIIPRDQKVGTLTEAGLKSMEGRGLSGDKNLWCNEVESGPLDNPEDFVIPEDDAYIWTRDVGNLPQSEIMLGFERGLVTSVDNKELDLLAIIDYLNVRVGKYCIGRDDGLEHIRQGRKAEASVLEVREAPAATIIFAALDRLVPGSLPVLEARDLKVRQMDWALEAAAGQWGSEKHTACGKYIDAAMQQVSGTVIFTLRYKELQARSIRPNNSICVTNRDIWEREQVANNENWDDAADS